MLLNCGTGLEKTLESHLDYTEIKPFNLKWKKKNPKYSLEGLMLKLNVQYFGHLWQRADSLRKTLMLGKTEGKRRGWQRMRYLDGITDSMDKRVKVKVTQSCLTLCDPMDYMVPGILQARILEWIAFHFSRGSSNPWVEPRSPALQVDSLPVEPHGKPMNTGVSSLSLLQRIFLAQESNQHLLHCKWIQWTRVWANTGR